uniref:TIR domain-containing protein n=1 Tax=Meloidogyne floridensis TaxID=298350 RepID=A0A915NQI7_9BILA
LRQIYLGGNPFRCDCSSNGRFLAQEWISLNQQKIKDAGKIQCVENVTRAKETNDTTIFSNYFPNINDDLFVMSMLEFLNQENSIPSTSRSSNDESYSSSTLEGPNYDIFICYAKKDEKLVLNLRR